MENPHTPSGTPSRPGSSAVIHHFFKRHRGFFLLVLAPILLLSATLYLMLSNAHRRSDHGLNAAIPNAHVSDTLATGDKDKAYTEQDRQTAEKLRREEPTAATPVNFDLLPPAGAYSNSRYATSGPLSPELQAQLQAEQAPEKAGTQDWAGLARQGSADSVIGPQGNGQPGGSRNRAAAGRNFTAGFYTVRFAADGFTPARDAGDPGTAADYGLSTAILAGRNFRAAVFRQGSVQDGSVLTFRLLEPLNTGALHIPVNTLVSGQAAITGNRLKVKISSVMIRGLIIPLILEAFDQDGLEGLRLPPGMEQRASRDEALRVQVDQAIGQGQSAVSQAEQLSGGSSLAALNTASGLGVGLIKAFQKSKARPLQITVPEGYQVTLKPKDNTGDALP